MVLCTHSIAFPTLKPSLGETIAVTAGICKTKEHRNRTVATQEGRPPVLAPHLIGVVAGTGEGGEEEEEGGGGEEEEGGGEGGEKRL